MKRIRIENLNTNEHFNEVFNESFEMYNSYNNIKYYNDILELELFDENASYLDYGCGNGDGMNYIQKIFQIKNMYGVDISTQVVKINKEKFPNINFLTLAEYESKPLPVDIVVSTHTFEHTENPLSIAESLLKYSKKLFVIVPYKESWSKCPEHLWIFNETSFKELNPTLSIPGLINKAGYREMIYFWDTDYKKLNILRILQIKIKIMLDSNYAGIIKYIFYFIKYKINPI